MGFINEDVTLVSGCTFDAKELIGKMGTVWHGMWHLNDNTTGVDNFREMLHILEKLPEDFKACETVTSILEKVARRVFIIFDLFDLLKTLAENLLFHSIQIMSLLADASVAMISGNPYKSGFALGRAFDVFFS